MYCHNNFRLVIMVTFEFGIVHIYICKYNEKIYAYKFKENNKRKKCML